MTTRTRSVSAVRARDWRYRLDDQEDQQHQTFEQLGNFCCPFICPPETTDSVPTEYKVNLQFETSTATSDSPPWTGYYARYNGVRLAVSNAYGVWFEIQLGKGNCYAIRKARASLQLKDWPLDGISLAAIEGSSEPLPSQMMRYQHSSPQRDNADSAPTRPADHRS